MKDSNYTEVYNIDPSNKQFVSVLPQKTHVVCRAATEPYTSFVRSALACGISSDWAQNHEEMHDIAVLSHHSGAAGTKEGLSFMFTPPGRGVSQFTQPLQGDTGQTGCEFNHHACSFSLAVFIFSVKCHYFSAQFQHLYELITFEIKVLIL